MREELRLDNQLCFRLYTASRLLTQAYHPLLSRLGLTYPQYLVMMVLWETDAQPVNDIAKRLLLETNTVTPLLKRMEAEGLVRREKPTGNGSDGRQVIVRMTQKGRDLESDAACVPYQISGAAACRSITAQSAPQLYGMLDDLIATLKR
ncbi:MAG: MarR family transcriptional regulator [Bacteroidales bacterium]|nr:MarR family transcriptional regulator [Bacteroidales bacterium]